MTEDDGWRQRPWTEVGFIQETLSRSGVRAPKLVAAGVSCVRVCRCMYDNAISPQKWRRKNSSGEEFPLCI